MRALGYMESIHARTHRLNGAIQFCCACRIEGRIESQRVVKAWRRLFDTHPLLRATITERRFEAGARFEDIPISFKVQDDVDWLLELKRELDNVLHSSRHLWRALVLATPDGHHLLFLTVHHAMADATSAASLARQFVDAYNGLSGGADAAPIAEYPLLEPVESYLPDAFCGARLHATAPAASTWSVEEWAPPAERTQLLLHKSCDQRELDRMLAVCRRNDVKLTGLLSTAMMLALEASMLSLGKYEQSPKRLAIKVPRNVRDLCSHAFSENELGDYITMPAVVYESRAEAPLSAELVPRVWNLARDFMRQYRLEPTIFRDDLATHVDPILDAVGNTETAEFRHGPILSNLGVVNLLTRKGELALKSFDFAIRNAPLNSSVGLAVTTCDGRLSCLFNFNTPLIRASTAARFFDDFWRVIDYACRERPYGSAAVGG